MIKKLEWIGAGICTILFIILLINYLNMDTVPWDESPSDVTFNFLEEMTEGNFEEAFDLYASGKPEEILGTLLEEEYFYKMHWKSYGITLGEEVIDEEETKAKVTIDVHKLNHNQIFEECLFKLKNVEMIKEDGTYLTPEEINSLWEGFVKDAFLKGDESYDVFSGTYDINLVLDEETYEWKIVPDKVIYNICFETANKNTEQITENIEEA